MGFTDSGFRCPCRWNWRSVLVVLAVTALLAGACGSEAAPPDSSEQTEAILADAQAAVAEARAAAVAASERADEAHETADKMRAALEVSRRDLAIAEWSAIRSEEFEDAAGALVAAMEHELERLSAELRKAEDAAMVAARAEAAARLAEQEARADQVAAEMQLAAATAEAETQLAAATAEAEMQLESAVAEARALAEQADDILDESNRLQRDVADLTLALEAALEELAGAEAASILAEAAAAAAHLEAEEAEGRAIAAEAAAAEAAEAARAAQEQLVASSTTTTTEPASPRPPEDMAGEDMGDYDMAADDMGAPARGSMSPASSPGSTSELPPGGCRGCEGNTFEDYGVNPFVDTGEDALSTFALDVDTASYVVSRNFLLGDQLPPPEAVRVEEFVNYFDGGYEPVADEFAVYLEAAPSPFAAEGHVLLRVGVRAPDTLHGVTLPESIVAVMDRSGSMGGDAGYRGQRLERIQLAHRAVELLLEGLADGTRVGIVSYDDQVETVVEPTDVAGNRDSIMTRVRDEVYPRGSTNAAAGLAAGFEMALAEADAGRSVLVLLLSDGVANVGATRTTEILEQIGERADIGLSTIGVGLGPFNDALMEQLANSADGTYHYIDSFREARRILADNLPSLLSVAARDAKVQVEFNPDTVLSYRLLGFENRDVADEDFRDNTVDAGEVGLGQSSTALYELELVPAGERPDGATKLATVTLRYEHPRRGSITEIEASIDAGAVAGSFTAAGARFRLAVVVAEFAEVLRQSPFVDEGDADMAELAAQAAAVAADLADDPDASDLVVLIEAARRVAGDEPASG